MLLTDYFINKNGLKHSFLYKVFAAGSSYGQLQNGW